MSDKRPLIGSLTRFPPEYPKLLRSIMFTIYRFFAKYSAIYDITMRYLDVIISGLSISVDDADSPSLYFGRKFTIIETDLRGGK